MTCMRGSYRHVRVFLVPSRFMADVLVRGGVPANRIELVPNFTMNPNSAMNSSRNATGAGTAGGDFVFAGRLERLKGIDLLLNAFGGGAVGVRLRIYGDGPLSGEVLQAVRRGAPIDYRGFHPPETVAEELRDALAVVIPSRIEENCPMVAVEARARGVPVIASDRGGLPELVDHGSDGLLTPADDEIALREALHTMAGDRERARLWGKQGYDRYLRLHTADAHYMRLMHAYDRAIGA
jgi:glycosyltransferase involved in cell wall biosynthesis